MATPIVSSHPQTISQFQLARHVTLTNQIEALQKEREELSSQLTQALADGAPVYPGTYTASLKRFERRSISWRSIVVRLKGEGYAQNVLKHTKPTVSTKLVVR